VHPLGLRFCVNIRKLADKVIVTDPPK